MKIALWILLFLVIAVPATIYLVQWLRQKKAEKDGTVIYATVLSTEPVRRFGKDLPMLKILLWLQEPDGTNRQVTISGRVDPKMAPKAGSKLPVVIDPKNPKRVYPASAEALKRVELTGPRRERRAMQAMTGTRVPRGQRQAPPSRGPMPPPRGRRG